MPEYSVNTVVPPYCGESVHIELQSGSQTFKFRLSRNLGLLLASGIQHAVARADRGAGSDIVPLRDAPKKRKSENGH